jgi:hypothetical protein
MVREILSVSWQKMSQGVRLGKVRRMRTCVAPLFKSARAFYTARGLNIVVVPIVPNSCPLRVFPALIGRRAGLSKSRRLGGFKAPSPAGGIQLPFSPVTPFSAQGFAPFPSWKPRDLVFNFSAAARFFPAFPTSHFLLFLPCPRPGVSNYPFPREVRPGLCSTTFFSPRPYVITPFFPPGSQFFPHENSFVFTSLSAGAIRQRNRRIVKIPTGQFIRGKYAQRYGNPENTHHVLFPEFLAYRPKMDINRFHADPEAGRYLLALLFPLCFPGS